MLQRSHSRESGNLKAFLHTSFASFLCFSKPVVALLFKHIYLTLSLGNVIPETLNGFIYWWTSLRFAIPAGE
jgi:hypothetical protein